MRIKSSRPSSMDTAVENISIINQNDTTTCVTKRFPSKLEFSVYHLNKYYENVPNIFRLTKYLSTLGLEFQVQYNFFVLVLHICLNGLTLLVFQKFCILDFYFGLSCIQNTIEIFQSFMHCLPKLYIAL